MQSHCPVRLSGGDSGEIPRLISHRRPPHVEAIGSDTIYNAYEGDPLSGTTGFTYDLNGNLLTVQDAKNQTTTYTYDSMDRLATRTDALNRTESYQYDKAGNLSQFTDRKGQVSTFGYDALNRRTSATYPGAAVTFGYDAIGRLTSVNDSVGGNITWVYDTVAGGHHPRVAETTSTGTMTVEYDEIGRRAKLSATGQADTTYGYDAASQFQTVTKGTQTVTLAYDDAGRRTSLTYPNGVVTSYGYDHANRLLSINHVKTPTTIESLTYTYDPAGNRLSQTRANAAASTLPTAVAAAQITYDAANELLRWNNATNNLTYDLNGNLATETVGGVTTTYTWDSRNRLTGLSGTGLTASFVYDGLGRRKSKTINGTTTGFWYDGNDVYAELSGATPSFTYIRGLSIDEPYIRKGASDEFYEIDALGSPVRLTNASGTGADTYTYEPFGKTTQSGTSSNPFQFTGRENDGTGLLYYRTRSYYPKCQRFTREDPLGILGGLNLYVYVNNAPTIYTDPSGLYGPGGAAAGAAVSVVGQLALNLTQSGGNIGRSLRCLNLSNVAISAAMGALGPTFWQQFVKGTPGPWLSGFPIPSLGERIIYVEVWLPLGRLTKEAAPEITGGDFLRLLPSALGNPLGARKDDDCDALSLRNSLGAFFQ